MRAAFSSKPRAEKGSAKPRALYHLTNVPRALSRSRRVSLFCSKTVANRHFFAAGDESGDLKRKLSVI
jgi:hypothetical protein